MSVLAWKLHPLPYEATSPTVISQIGKAVFGDSGGGFLLFYAEDRDEVRRAMQEPPADTPLGLYLHIPFCRKRCKFCYFRVYTDKNGDGWRDLPDGKPLVLEYAKIGRAHV